MRFYELKAGYAEIGLNLEYKVGDKGKGYYINTEFITKIKEDIIEDMHMRFEMYYFEHCMKVFFVDRDLFIANDDAQVDIFFEKIYSRPRNLQRNEDIVEMEVLEEDTIFVTNKHSNEVEEMVYENLLLQGYIPTTMFHDFDEEKENPLEGIKISISTLISVINDKIKMPCRICRSINYHLNMFEYDSM